MEYIYNYVDVYKNKRWQPYAAAVAVAYVKELLCVILANQVVRTRPIEEMSASGCEMMPLKDL